MKAYFNYVNDNGGVFGRKINLLVADDQLNPAKTTVEVKRLVENDNVFAIVGGLGTPGCLAVVDYLNNAKVPFVYQGSGASVLAIPPKNYVFTVQPNYTLEGNIMIRHMYTNLKARRIAIVYRNADDGKEEYLAAKAALERFNLKPVAEIAINPSATDFSTEMTKLVAAKPDAIILMAFIQQAPQFIKQAKQYGLSKAKIVGTYSISDASLITLTGKDSEGVQAMAWVNVDFSNPDQDVFKIYGKYNNNQMPNAYAIAGMIAAEIFTEGLKRTGADLTRDKLVKALETLNKWTGVVAHEITYGPYNVKDTSCRMGKQSMYVLEVKDGVFATASDWVSFVQ
ncbi:MAG TPA: ABC transporter substrate-binding protein, partial [Petrotogaceae bacterium]|nr:ABC transporter substrate-binding protein [Petrotogaceae bacterium]